MPPSESPQSYFERRADWSREEWTIALDACPKDRQRYGSSSRDVREVAYLINRTPAAVSRAFANLWAAMTDGREGLTNYATLCGTVVAAYRNNWGRLHRDALELRREFLDRTLAPRIEFRGRLGSVLSDHDLRRFSLAASRETHVPSRFFVVYHRDGSVLEGAILVSNLLGGLAGGVYLLKEFINWVERRVEGRVSNREFEVIRTRTWAALRRGDVATVEETIISYYLPSNPLSDLDRASRHALASYLDAALGVGRVWSETRALPRRPPSRARVRAMQRRVGANFAQLSTEALCELDGLLRAVETSGFRRAVRRLRQTQLDDYEH